MEIASSATGTWQDLVLLSVGSAYRWEGLSREALGLEASVLGGVGINHWRHCCRRSIFLERLF
jgi:hypothetical protein